VTPNCAELFTNARGDKPPTHHGPQTPIIAQVMVAIAPALESLVLQSLDNLIRKGRILRGVANEDGGRADRRLLLATAFGLAECPLPVRHGRGRDPGWQPAPLSVGECLLQVGEFAQLEDCFWPPAAGLA
jgi:hypothetical protein